MQIGCCVNYAPGLARCAGCKDYHGEQSHPELLMIRFHFFPSKKSFIFCGAHYLTPACAFAKTSAHRHLQKIGNGLMKGSSSSPVPFYPLPPDKGDYHYTLYSRTVKENRGKMVTGQLWVGLGCFDAGGFCLFRAAGLMVLREGARLRLAPPRRAIRQKLSGLK
jgi:hypothetical protein